MRALRYGHQIVEHSLGFSEFNLSISFVFSLPLRMRIKSIERLVLVSFTDYSASTPSLLTWWSSTALKGNLVLRGASRLDAFSGYLVHT